MTESPRSFGGRPQPKAQPKVFVEGRYRKLVRDLPQTVFFCPDCKGHPRRRHGCARCEGFGKLTRDSVQELIGWVLGAAFKTRKHKFHGAGREDINVRMLGSGRPFVVELIGPKVLDVDLAALEAEINRRNEGRLEVLGLHWTEKARVAVIKEEKHAKEYGARVRVAASLERAAADKLIGVRTPIVQQTPERVAHRRANLERERWIEIVSLEQLSELEWMVVLRAQHGTYVKEAISGEGGSTRPSVAQLFGVACECVELDVLGILGEEGEAQAKAATPPSWGAFVD
jgi:tRNA pseudouridine synthase 10